MPSRYASSLQNSSVYNSSLYNSSMYNSSVQDSMEDSLPDSSFVGPSPSEPSAAPPYNNVNPQIQSGYPENFPILPVRSTQPRAITEKENALDVCIRCMEIELDKMRRSGASLAAQHVIQTLISAMRLPYDQIYNALRSRLPPAVYLHVDVRSTDVYRFARQCLDLMGKRAERRAGLSIAKATSIILYEGDDRKITEAMSRLVAPHSKNTRPATTHARPCAAAATQTSGLASAAASANGDPFLALAAAVQHNFMDPNDQFSGHVLGSTSMQIMRARFLTIMHGRSVREDIQVQLLVYCLRDDAVAFYNANVKDKVTRIEEAFRMLDLRFNNLTNQLLRRGYLYDLSIHKLKQQYGCSDEKALQIVHKRISELLPQSRRDYTAEDAKIDMLFFATRGNVWAEMAFNSRVIASQRSDTDWTFQDMNEELFYQLDVEKRRMQQEGR